MSTKIREIIQRYFRNDQPQRVVEKFTSWINQTAGKSEKDAVLNSIWDDLEIAADASTEKSFDKLMLAIHSRTVRSNKQRIHFVHRLSKIAAVLALMMFSVGITYFVMKNPITVNSDISLVECIVPNGEIRTVTLPDSSVVIVNSGSVLIYPQQFSSKRDIFLNGEAYFSVTKDKTKPFIVKTTDMDVEVLGTTFNVSSYADSENSSTTLERGKVNIRFKNTDNIDMILSPDEQVVYDRKSHKVEKNKVRVENAIAWTRGNLIIKSMSIEEVIKVIERKYAVKVYYNSNNYEDERITMKITNGESLSEFMRVLKLLVPQMQCKIESDRLYIY